MIGFRRSDILNGTSAAGLLAVVLAKADSRFWDWVILWMWCCDSYLSVKYFKAPFCVKHVVRLWDSYVCTYLGIVSPYIPTSCYCEEVELPPGNRPLKSAHHISQLRVTISYKYLVWIHIPQWATNGKNCNTATIETKYVGPLATQLLSKNS